MTPIGEIFTIIQGHQITDEELYKTEGNIPVLTGRNELKGYWNQSLVDKKMLPCITYPTKGNAGNAYVQYGVFDANNTAVLIVKEEWKSKIVLEWFAFKLQHIFLEIQTSKEGVSYINKDIIEPYLVQIPDKKNQEKELKNIQKLQGLREKLSGLLDKVDALLNKAIVYE